MYRVEAYHLAVGTPPGMKVATAVDGTADRRDIELSDLPYLLVGKNIWGETSKRIVISRINRLFMLNNTVPIVYKISSAP